MPESKSTSLKLHFFRCAYHLLTLIPHVALVTQIFSFSFFLSVTPAKQKKQKTHTNITLGSPAAGRKCKIKSKLKKKEMFVCCDMINQEIVQITYRQHNIIHKNPKIINISIDISSNYVGYI